MYGLQVIQSSRVKVSHLQLQVFPPLVLSLLGRLSIETLTPRLHHSDFNSGTQFIHQLK